MFRSVLPILAAVALVSCAAGPTSPGGSGPATVESSAAGAAFDAHDFAWSTVTGGGAISGALNYHQGVVRYTCQGSDVLLTPQTAWSRRRMIILYGSANAAAAPVSIVRARTPSAGTGDYARFVRRTTCDMANRFSFRGLPDGSWFVITIAKPVDGAGEPMAVTRRVETHGGLISVSLS